MATSVPGEWRDAAGQTVATRAMEGWRVTAAGSRLTLVGQGTHLQLTAPAQLHPLGEGGKVSLVYAAGRWYRGAVELRATGHHLTVVNCVPLESYLYGVVPAEMNANWPLESLKAQAVAARTYALAKLGQFASHGFDLRPTTENQVYHGAAAESNASNKAVDETWGQVLTSHGRVIAAYFCASSGGYTETSDAVWGEPRSYLQAQPDFDQDSPHYLWQKNVPAAQLAHALTRSGVQVGDLLRFEVLERSFSGRVKKVRAIGTAGSHDCTGDTLRIAAGLYSTLFNVQGFGDHHGEPTTFAFAGRGWGHGLGLSQWGAKELAQRGYSYSQILGYYYPSTQLSSVEALSRLP